MNGDENPVCIPGIFETVHRGKPRSEMMNVQFKSIGCWLDARIFKVVLECPLCCQHEASVGLELDGIHAEEIVVNMANAVMLPCVPGVGRGMQEQHGIAVQKALLAIALRFALVAMTQCQLQAGAQITKQMHVTALLHDAAGVEDTTQSWQSVRCRSCNGNTALLESVKKFAVDFARLAGGTKLAGDQAGLDVPDEVLAKLLSANRQGFCVHENNPAGLAWIQEFQVIESVLDVAQDCCGTQSSAISDAAVGAPIKQIHLDQGIRMTE